MSGVKNAVFRIGLETLYFSGAHRAFRPAFGGLGAIFTLHHVRPARREAFQPNGLLEITPDYLDQVLTRVRRRGYAIVTMDEAAQFLEEGAEKPFVAFTFDDGYRDNLDHALPVMRKHGAPFTLYLPTGFIDGVGDLWWRSLEEVVRRQNAIATELNGTVLHLDSETPAEKQAAFEALYWRLRALPEAQMRAAIHDLAGRYGVDWRAFCRAQCMSWDEIAQIAADPLVTIGAHTVDHLMLAKWDEPRVRREMEASRAILESMIGRKVAHFAYPVGDPTSAGPREFALARDLGFRTAVTTRPGLLYPDHGDHLHALPRVSLNGRYQSARYIDVFLSGAPFALVNRFRKVNAA